MKKPNEWDNTNAVIGSGVVYTLPVDNYICHIVDAQETVSKSGKQMLKIAFDVSEGEYADFYRKRFEADKKKDPSTAKWNRDGIYYQLTQGNAMGRFKGLIKCLEDSNSNWQWDWNEKKLVGLKFCGQFRNEPQEYNGKTYNHTVLVNIYPISEIDKLSVLPDKEITSSSSNSNGFGGQEVDPDSIPF